MSQKKLYSALLVGFTLSSTHSLIHSLNTKGREKWVGGIKSDRKKFGKYLRPDNFGKNNPDTP